MELTNEFRVSVPVEDAWNVLTDVERIAPCLPGAQLQEIEEDEYRGIVKVKVGPITAQYKGKATFKSRDDVGHVAVLKAEGRDTRGQGNASALITATLTPDGDGTAVVVHTNLTITGKVAQFGRGVLVDVSGKLLTQFVECLEHDLLSSSSMAAAAGASSSGSSSSGPSSSGSTSSSNGPSPAKPAAVTPPRPAGKPSPVKSTADPSAASAASAAKSDPSAASAAKSGPSAASAAKTESAAATAAKTEAAPASATKAATADPASAASAKTDPTAAGAAPAKTAANPSTPSPAAAKAPAGVAGKPEAPVEKSAPEPIGAAAASATPPHGDKVAPATATATAPAAASAPRTTGMAAKAEPSTLVPATETATPPHGDAVTAEDDKPKVRKIEHQAAEPVDLLDAAGVPMAKRAIPLVAGVLVIVWFLRRRNRNRSRRS